MKDKVKMFDTVKIDTVNGYSKQGDVYVIYPDGLEIRNAKGYSYIAESHIKRIELCNKIGKPFR